MPRTSPSSYTACKVTNKKSKLKSGIFVIEEGALVRLDLKKGLGWMSKKRAIIFATGLGFIRII